MDKEIRYITTQEDLAKAVANACKPLREDMKRQRIVTKGLMTELKELRTQLGKGVEIKEEVKEFMKPIEAEKYIGMGKKSLLRWAKYFHVTKNASGFYKKEDLDMILEGRKNRN